MGVEFADFLKINSFSLFANFEFDNFYFDAQYYLLTDDASVNQAWRRRSVG